MTQSWGVVTPSTYEPVTSQEAKDHCRITGTGEDTLIAALILAAREYVEAEAWRTLMPSVQTLTLDAWPASDTIELPRPPLQSVTSIIYTDSDGASHTFSSASYVVDSAPTPGRIRLKLTASWPSAVLKESGAIVITYIAGVSGALAEAGTVTAIRALVSERHKAAIKLIVGHLYENREAIVIGAGLTAINLPIGVSALLMPDRAFRFG